MLAECSESIQEFVIHLTKVSFSSPLFFTGGLCGSGKTAVVRYLVMSVPIWKAFVSNDTFFVAGSLWQGLLYYYAKYFRRSVTVLKRKGQIESWRGVWNETAKANITTLVPPSWTKEDIDNAMADRIGLPGKQNNFGGSIVKSFIHFSGPWKPWMKGPPPPDERTSEHQRKSTKHYWFWKLNELNEELKIGLDVDTHWSSSDHRPSLGLWPRRDSALKASTNILTPLRKIAPSLRRTDRRLWRVIGSDSCAEVERVISRALLKRQPGKANSWLSNGSMHFRDTLSLFPCSIR